MPAVRTHTAFAQRASLLGTLVAHLLEELKAMNSLPAALSQSDVQTALASGVELPTDCFAQLYKTATSALATQLAKSGGHAPLTALDTELLCRCVLSCRNLEDAIQRAIDFCSIIHPRGGKLMLERHADVEFFINFAGAQDNPAAHLIEITSLFSYQQLFSWLIGEPLRLRSVALAHGDSADAALFLRFFDVPISVGQMRTGFTFDAAQLSRPVVRQPGELENLLATYPFPVLGAAGTHLTTAQQVRAFLNAALAQQRPLPNSAEIAAALDISDATLRRRLRDEHTSYLALRERSLLEAAEYHLRNTDRDIEQIASFLGFSDSTAFRRAFHRWTGQAPSTLRRGAKPQSAA